MGHVENVAGVLVYALAFGPGVHIFNYSDKADLDMNESPRPPGPLSGTAAQTLHILYLLGIGAGIISDQAAWVTGRRFPVSAIRVRKYRANTQFANVRVLATSSCPTLICGTL